MGKREKRQKQQQRASASRRADFSFYAQDHEEGYEADYSYPSSLPSSSDQELPQISDEDDDDRQEQDDQNDPHSSTNMPSKFLLYQQSVQVLLIRIYRGDVNRIGLFNALKV